MIAENAELIIAAMTIIGGLIGKLWSDSGKKSLIKELDEAKTALTKTAECVAPGLDLAFNVATGKFPLDELTLNRLADCSQAAWIEAKAASKEVADVLVVLEDIRRSK